MAISYNCLWKWKKLHPEFAKAIKDGKEYPDSQVQQALFKRAMGYTFEEVVKEPVKIENPAPEVGIRAPFSRVSVRKRKPKSILVETKRTVKQVAPDVLAQIFWLKNRQPDRWRDRQEVKHSGLVSYKIIPAEFPVEDENSEEQSTP